MALLRKLFWLAVFILSTLCFVVLFEHGPEKFQQNLTNQITEFRNFVDQQMHPKKDDSH